MGYGEEPPEKLLPHPANWREHPQRQRRALADVLGRVGWVDDVTVNRRTGRIINGHLRVRMAIERREPSVPVRYVDLSEDEERLVLATLDPITGLAVADTAALDELLQQVDAGEGALAELIESVAADAGLPIGGTVTGLVDPDEAPDQPAPEDVCVRPGDIYVLGDNRLMCGDSADATSVQTLLNGATVDLLLTDPPFGVSYNADARPGNRSRRFRGAGKRRPRARAIRAVVRLGPRGDPPPARCLLLHLLRRCDGRMGASCAPGEPFPRRCGTDLAQDRVGDEP